MKIAVGMSGGVDSSVAAFLLKKDGHDVFGVHMKLWRSGSRAPATRGNTCYGPEESEDGEDIRNVCAALDMECREIDCSESYEKIVLEYFRKEYRSGRTPNPCVRCNQEIKFGVLPESARKAGLSFDRFATGHYARVCFDTGRNRWLLRRGLDARKDQTYFLYRLSQEQLSASMFPLGAMTKEEVREIAGREKLAVHDKRESQDFYSGDYADIIGEEHRPGDIVDLSGRVLGRHRGVWNYTVGQRKGLGIAHREPLYVLSIDAENSRVVVGNEKETKRSVFTAVDCSWVACENPAGEFTAKVKIRSAMPAVEARISPCGKEKVNVTFFEPRSAITPGQSAVFYDGDIVIGGGIIDTVD